MEPSTGYKGQPFQYIFSQCQLRLVELREQQYDKSLQSADQNTNHPHIIGKLEYNAFKYWHDVKFYGQPVTEHARFKHRPDSTRLKHFD